MKNNILIINNLKGNLLLKKEMDETTAPKFRPERVKFKDESCKVMDYQWWFDPRMNTTYYVISIDYSSPEFDCYAWDFI